MFDKLPPSFLYPFDSLRRRLAILFAVVLLPPTVLSIYLAWSAFEEQTEKARLSVRQFAVLVSAYERDFFRDTQRLITSLAAEPSIQAMTAGDCQDTLGRALENFPEYVSISVADPKGRVLCSTTESDTPVDISHRRWFQNAVLSRSFTISDYTLGQNTSEPVIVAAAPIRDADNKIQGLLYIDIDLDWLGLFVRGAGLPPNGVVFLLDKNGVILASPKYIFEPTEAGLPDAATLRQVTQRKLIDFEALGRDGQKRVYSSVALPHGNVLVLFGLPSATTLGWIERDLLTRMLSLAAIWLAGIFAAGIGTRLWVTRWISQLVRTARSYSRGNFDVKVNLDRAPVELRDLGDTMEKMAQRIELREEDLRQSLEQKDVLLKEIHHRVKNNLQTITSMVNIRMRSVVSSDARRALEEVQTRVRALALVHRYLYESDDVRQVDLRLFVGELCQVLDDTLGGTKRHISVEAEIDNITIASDRAVPIALLITEAVTNAFKHAFPNGREGQVMITINRRDEDHALLVIQDDGVGYPGDEAAVEKTQDTATGRQGLGMSLISAFARQLGDDLELSGPPGARLSLRLRLRPAAMKTTSAAPSRHDDEEIEESLPHQERDQSGTSAQPEPITSPAASRSSQAASHQAPSGARRVS
ncbi:MAG: cache domain-containing protein [Pseudomonadota bacterium]